MIVEFDEVLDRGGYVLDVRVEAELDDREVVGLSATSNATGRRVSIRRSERARLEQSALAAEEELWP